MLSQRATNTGKRTIRPRSWTLTSKPRAKDRNGLFINLLIRFNCIICFFEPKSKYNPSEYKQEFGDLGTKPIDKLNRPEVEKKLKVDDLK
jgi:hypothetical protein